MAKQKPTPTDSGAPTPDEMLAARDALARGKLVGLPTESGYAAVVNITNTEDLARLRKTAGPGISYLLARDAEAASQWFQWNAPARRLANRYWPGPLILGLPIREPRPPWFARALPDPKQSFYYVRNPAGSAARALLDAASDPLLAFELNHRGRALARESDLSESLRREMPVCLKYKTAAAIDAPAIVKIGPGLFEVEREGLLTKENLLKAAGRRILLVCTGNTCRSPMAQTVLRGQIAAALGGKPELNNEQLVQFLDRFGYRVESAGIAPFPGAPASPHALSAVEELEYSLEGHSARVASFELLSEFDIALTMTAGHARRLRDFAPESLQIERLDPSSDIEDPFGASLEMYRSVLHQIRAAVAARLPDLL
ncbi:MAG: Sua5/YciO/YrdC/YwlC family protein [Planctomycetes bacterium]|nr:Sua5/YciO/YrdC/YwlC family protein [Planctomycetota bacterium]